MATFLLIHGAWQASWVWRDVLPLLQRAGHDAVAPDLPGHGANGPPLEDLQLADYVGAIAQVVDRLDKPPIVVSHSVGGVAMILAEKASARIRAIVYLAAIVPRPGTTMMDVVSGADPEYLAQLTFTPDGRRALISPEGARRFLYPLCPVDVQDDVIPWLTPEPVAPFQTVIDTTPEKLGRVPAYYIECLRDAVIPVAIQREMQANAPIKRVLPLDTDHSPFFSAPAALVRSLEAIAHELT